MFIALAHSHPNTFGGGERAMLEVGKRLALRHDVRLLVGDYRAELTYPGLAGFQIERLRALDWFIRGVPDNVVIANSFGSNLLSLRNGSRVVYWVHSVRSTFLRRDARSPSLLARRALDYVAVRRAARIVANSQYTAQRIASLYGRAADAVAYPGVDLEQLSPSSQGKARLGAVTVSRLAQEKGVDRLLDAWRSLPDVPLTVIGDGPERKNLEAAAPANVTFSGPLGADALLEAYRSAAVAVFAPREEELGIAPLEAMACGTPVVAWREGGLLETVDDGQTGYLVGSVEELAERVRDLVASEPLRSQMGNAARRRAEAFSWDRTSEVLESVCLDVARPAQ